MFAPLILNPVGSELELYVIALPKQLVALSAMFEIALFNVSVNVVPDVGLVHDNASPTTV
jgi:hypothetical protein